MYVRGLGQEIKFKLQLNCKSLKFKLLKFSKFTFLLISITVYFKYRLKMCKQGKNLPYLTCVHSKVLYSKEITLVIFSCAEEKISIYE